MIKNSPTHSILALSSLALACLMSFPAQAIVYGITIDNTTVINNPYNGKPENAWKLSGTNGMGCSGFRISREWVMATQHCGFAEGAPFESELGRALVDGSTCSNATEANIADSGIPLLKNNGPDIQICRLANLGTLTEPDRYPPLVVAPMFTPENTSKFGALMIRGTHTLNGNATQQLALIDFNGIPISFDPLSSDWQAYVSGVKNGDSGSAAYWLPTNGAPAALVGVVASVKEAQGGLALVPWYFTQGNLDALQKHIASHGKSTDQQPVILSDSGAYGSVQSLNQPAPLSALPKVTTNGTPSQVTATWLPPSGGGAVATYKVGVFNSGTKSVRYVTSPSVTVNGLTAGNSTLCVTPSSSTDPSNIQSLATTTYAVPATGTFTDPLDGQSYRPNQAVVKNCVKYDTTLPPAVSALQIGSASFSSSLSTISAKWGAQPAATGSYRVLQTTTLPTGIKKSATLEVTTNAFSASAAKGNKVCVKVTPISTIQVLGPTSPEVCVLAN